MSSIRIESSPIEVALKLGQDIKVNLGNDNYNDLYIKLDRVSGARAYFSVKEIHEAITPIATPVTKSAEKPLPQPTPTPQPAAVQPPAQALAKPGYMPIIVAVVIIALILAVYFTAIKPKNKA